jgi:hypothetical protein
VELVRTFSILLVLPLPSPTECWLALLWVGIANCLLDDNAELHRSYNLIERVGLILGGKSTNLPITFHDAQIFLSAGF